MKFVIYALRTQLFNTPFLLATRHAHVEVMIALMEHKQPANIEARNMKVMVFVYDSRGPL